MGRKKQIHKQLQKKRTQRHTWGPTGVAGFLEKVANPPKIEKRSCARKTPDFSSFSVHSCSTACQTDAPAVISVATQTEIPFTTSTQSFLQMTLQDKLAHISKLERVVDNLYPAHSINIPFLLPYPLMCLIFFNVRFALHSLFTHNTSLRKSFLKVLFSGLEASKSILAPLLGFSLKTLQRAERPAPLRLIGQAFKKPPRKSVNDPQAISDAKQILDALAPVKSGKSFRVVSCSLSFLYEQYRALATQISVLPPLCYNTFIGKILDIKNNYVHFENNPDFCPLCRECDELQLHPTPTPAQTSRIATLLEHKRVAQVQWQIYHSCMENLLKNPGHRVVVQDFNQQHANTSLQTQVLTLVVYAAPSGFLERHYFNYFLPVNQSNNLTAVIACHRDFFFNPANTILTTATHFDIFNDGGPKHFKLTGYLAHMCAVANLISEKIMIQHYFASYHGSGPADAVASHMKRKIHYIRANFRHNPKSVAEMAQLCSDIENTDKSVAIAIPQELLLEESSVSVETFTGIKKYHKATFGPNQAVSLWVDSTSTTPSVAKTLIASGILA